MLLLYFILLQIPQDLPQVKTKEVPADSNLEYWIIAGAILLILFFIWFLKRYRIGKR